MRKLSLVLALALSTFTSSPAYADPPIEGPGSWGYYILCVEGYRAVPGILHPVHTSWGPLNTTCVPDR